VLVKGSVHIVLSKNDAKQSKCSLIETIMGKAFQGSGRYDYNSSVFVLSVIDTSPVRWRTLVKKPKQFFF
jgi:hypothetical protein